MIPTETEISHFLEVYSTRHFTRASVKLGITQPTLTQSIFRLEEKLGGELFHRTKQGCIPTRSADLLRQSEPFAGTLERPIDRKSNRVDSNAFGSISGRLPSKRRYVHASRIFRYTFEKRARKSKFAFFTTGPAKSLKK